jgi:hypothetical protein
MKAEIRTNQERMETEIEATRRELQTELKKVEAGAESGRKTGTGVGARSHLSSTGLRHGPCVGASSRS